MFSPAARTAMKYEVASAFGYPLVFTIIWIILSLLGIDPPLLGPALAIGAIFLSKAVDIYVQYRGDRQTMDVLVVRAGLNILLAMIAFLLTGVLSIFASAPRGPVSFLIAFASIMGIICVGRAVMFVTTILATMDANTIADYFNWHQQQAQEAVQQQIVHQIMQPQPQVIHN